mmetsp:Transcript_49447/g.116071  ORF Transcript_49447/g.116071 Transcript_49447/m.116071 type:complete len:81 (-) Transcript_49447:141-383(-)
MAWRDGLLTTGPGASAEKAVFQLAAAIVLVTGRAPPPGSRHVVKVSYWNDVLCKPVIFSLASRMVATEHAYVAIEANLVP